VTYSEGYQFYLDDGCNLWDGTLDYGEEPPVPVLGIRVQAPTDSQGQSVCPPVDSYVAVTGIMRCQGYFGEPETKAVRWLMPRDPSDVDVVLPP
jgi:hypothetical protein